VKADIHIGPAGWSYPDWNGIVYPTNPARGFDPLAYLASYFNLIEINSTFYRIPAPRMCERWAERVDPFPDFRFTVKAFRDITHGKQRATRGDVDAFKKAVAPLAAARRLNRVLVQFPWSFRFNETNAGYLRQLAEWFQPIDVSFEVRNGSWDSGEAGNFAQDQELNMCCIDQPVIGDSLGSSRFNFAGSAAYFRLHGRNYREWFRPNSDRDQRYNYFYSHDAMVRWSQRIRDAAQQAHRVHVVLNNHFRGQAVANALELMAVLSGTRPKAPSSLFRKYPRLSEVLTRDRGTTQPSLFDDEDEQD
jgi:uncharacterized protein YecE (DUF72 family)